MWRFHADPSPSDDKDARPPTSLGHVHHQARDATSLYRFSHYAAFLSVSLQGFTSKRSERLLLQGMLGGSSGLAHHLSGRWVREVSGRVRPSFDGDYR